MKLKTKPQAKKLPQSNIQAKPVNWGVPVGHGKAQTFTTPGTTVNQSKLKSITDVSNADFVKVWMTSKTNLEVAKKLHLTPGQTTSRASFLRNKGVNLPRKLNAHDPNSVEALNKIVKKYSR